MTPLLLLDVAALSPSQIGEHTPNLARLAAQGAMTPLVPPFGALTCPAQISMITGQRPSAHGIVGNGWYDREHGRIFNWNRSNHLVGSPQIFEAIREREPKATTASLMWRHAAHSSADLKVIERPTYWASGKKSFDFYTEPPELHADVRQALGAFPFPQFWGPMAGWKSTDWILKLTEKVLTDQRPALTLSYAPFLDYDGQRYGPDDPRSITGLKRLDAGLGPLLKAATHLGVEVAVVSDYGFVTVDTPVYLNRALREAGLLAVHPADNGEVLEAAASRAFAHCDNQLAHVYVRAPKDRPRVAALLHDLPGVRQVLGPVEIEAAGLAHARSGDLLCVAEPHAWFAYPYWLSDDQAPDFMKCIAIFDKPGFDPCELFLPPGLGGKLHLAKRVLQKKLGLAVPFDVIDADDRRVGGARNVDQADLANGAVLITSWPRPTAAALPTEAVYQIMLDRMFP
jgi:predicted AlkP superfamily pyrophosphatase or phosphodiesterase